MKNKIKAEIEASKDVVGFSGVRLAYRQCLKWAEELEKELIEIAYNNGWSISRQEIKKVFEGGEK